MFFDQQNIGLIIYEVFSYVALGISTHWLFSGQCLLANTDALNISLITEVERTISLHQFNVLKKKTKLREKVSIHKRKTLVDFISFGLFFISILFVFVQSAV